jgi:tRNA(Arg) A34 adenosine deaminase TadA
MSQTQSDFMREAIRLAEENVRNGGGPFGAIVVRHGKIIATGTNRVTLENDPTAHAEVSAIREACRVLGSFQLADCEIYSSCEPCPMCLGAIYWARPAKLYFGATRKEAAEAEFDDAFIYSEINLSPENRKIPMEHILLPESEMPFILWEKRPDKKAY